jgi:hypothetical protein
MFRNGPGSRNRARPDRLFVPRERCRATPERVRQTPGPEDEVPTVGDPAFSVTRPADMWLIGRHLLVCEDSRFADPLRILLDGEEADFIFTPASRRVRTRSKLSI